LRLLDGVMPPSSEPITKPETATFVTTTRQYASGAIPYRLLLLGLCAAYLQGGLSKALDLGAAAAEMQHFGLTPALPFAVATICLELGASLLIVTGIYRRLAALSLAGFTLVASLLANAFWTTAGPERLAMTNAFMEHIGLASGFLLVAWYETRRRF
jgi:uncharacterized membrane protein YphA (DoxX/SURF4 family)